MIAQSIRRFPLWSFFLLAYGLNIALSLINGLVIPLPRMLLAITQAATPTMAALVVAASIDGRQAMRAVLKGFSVWRVNWRWYLAAFLMTGIPLLIALVYILTGNPVRGLRPDASLAVFLNSFAICLFSGPLAEEAGWRGFALPRLQQRFNALVSSLILGLLWAFWHVPFYLDPHYRAAGMPFPVFVGVVTGLSVLFTWIYNNSGGSLVLTVLAHFFFNFSSVFLVQYFGLLPPMWLYVGGGGLMLLLTVWVVLYFGPRRLSRKPLAQLPQAAEPVSQTLFAAKETT